MSIDNATEAEVSVESGPSSTSRIPPPTILSRLQQLTDPTANSLTQPLPLVHPYAPHPNSQPAAAARKGKGRVLDEATVTSVEGQIALVRQLRSDLEAARAALSTKDGDWGKLSRALKEIGTHQSARLPVSQALAQISQSSPFSYREPLIPFSRCNLPPTELLMALARSHGLQTYLEDSQFGLLKTSLTLAGHCFVLDIDLEMDTADGAEDDGMAVTPALTPVSRPGTSAGGAPKSGASGLQYGMEGRVRLSKVGVNHVTADGETGKSDWVASVMREAVRRYLAAWSALGEASGVVETNARGKHLESEIRILDNLFGELKGLDGEAAGGQDAQNGVSTSDSAWFSAVEQVASRVQRLIEGNNERGPPIHASFEKSIFPSFQLLPPSPATLKYNPILRLRPAASGESGLPFHPDNSKDTPGVDTGGESRHQRLWVVEVIPTEEYSGIVTRRDWLSESRSRLDHGSQWDGGIKVENLLYKPKVGSESALAAINPFPFQSEFVHREGNHNGGNEPLDQHWTLSSPGPDGYLVGRFVLPSTDEKLLNILDALRVQVNLNMLFLSVFTASALAPGLRGGAASEVHNTTLDDFDALMSDPTAIPINVSQTLDSLILRSPLPHSRQPNAQMRVEVKVGRQGSTSFAGSVEGAEDDGAAQAVVATCLSGIEQDPSTHLSLPELFRQLDKALQASQSPS